MNPQFSVKNKVVVITGGGGVLGSCVARSLAASGANIALITRNESALDQLVKELNETEGEAITIQADILSEASLLEAKNKVINHFGGVDILLNIAGGNLPGATIGEDQTIFDLAIEDFDAVTKLNLNGTVIPSLIFGKAMADKKEGIIINYSSMAVQQAITRVAGYSASKAAMENFTRWMSVEMATKFGDKIRVNAIAPGFFIGKQNKRLLLNEDGSYTKRGQDIINNTPMGRFGNADELNGVIHFLCSDASKFITGVVIPVDGGFSAFSGV
jgi:NAD(P)-dependent dehydrogenase (short-subunit alcohol dehydrogenase family)